MTSNGGSRPVPDPTVLTTEALRHEIAALKEVLEGRIDSHAQLDDLRFANIYTRLEQLNKFREIMQEERAEFLRRDYYDAAHTRLQEETREVAEKSVDRRSWDAQRDTLTDRISQLERYFSEGVGRDVGGAAAQQRLYVIGGLLFAAVSIIVTVLLATHG